MIVSEWIWVGEIAAGQMFFILKGRKARMLNSKVHFLSLYKLDMTLSLDKLHFRYYVPICSHSDSKCKWFIIW